MMTMAASKSSPKTKNLATAGLDPTRPARKLHDILDAADRRIAEGAGIPHDEFWRQVAQLTAARRVELARRNAELDARPGIALTWDQIRAGVETKRHPRSGCA